HELLAAAALPFDKHREWCRARALDGAPDVNHRRTDAHERRRLRLLGPLPRSQRAADQGANSRRRDAERGCCAIGVRRAAHRPTNDNRADDSAAVAYRSGGLHALIDAVRSDRRREGYDALGNTWLDVATVDGQSNETSPFNAEERDGDRAQLPLHTPTDDGQRRPLVGRFLTQPQCLDRVV